MDGVTQIDDADGAAERVRELLDVRQRRQVVDVAADDEDRLGGRQNRASGGLDRRAWTGDGQFRQTSYGCE